MKITLEQRREKVHKHIDMVQGENGFTPNNLLALRISIDKYLWKHFNGDGEQLSSPASCLFLKQVVEKLPDDTSIQMLKHKIEFWKFKLPDSKIGYDHKTKAIVKEVRA